MCLQVFSSKESTGLLSRAVGTGGSPACPPCHAPVGFSGGDAKWRAGGLVRHPDGLQAGLGGGPRGPPLREEGRARGAETR